MKLYEYGILQENSDIRAHVSPVSKCIYVFKTANAIATIKTKTYTPRPAYQAGVTGATAMGYAVPVNDIPDIRIVRWDTTEWWKYFDPSHSTTYKGKLAVRVVQRAIMYGLFPLWVSSVPDEADKAMDLQGTDIILSNTWKIQVKCDYNAGEGGTGNLYIQIAERNPNKKF